jgi:hypothetical protein
MEENEPVAEPTEAPAEPAAEPSVIDTLVNEVSDKLEARKTNRDLDYIEMGDRTEPSNTSTNKGAETIESLREDLRIEKERSLRVESHHGARSLRDEVKERFTNAHPDTVEKYVKLVESGVRSADSVKPIFYASNRDFSRGEEASDLKWQAKFKELQENAKAEAEAVVENAWGKPPPVSSALNGKDSITIEEFNVALKDSSMTDAQLEQLKAKVKF